MGSFHPLLPLFFFSSVTGSIGQEQIRGSAEKKESVSPVGGSALMNGNASESLLYGLAGCIEVNQIKHVFQSDLARRLRDRSLVFLNVN